MKPGYNTPPPSSPLGSEQSAPRVGGKSKSPKKTPQKKARKPWSTEEKAALVQHIRDILKEHLYQRGKLDPRLQGRICPNYHDQIEVIMRALSRSYK